MPENDKATGSELAKDSQYTASEFEMREYDRDREHELELNRFTHTFEVERVKALFY